MINWREFLIKQDINFGTYALIKYDNHIEATWIRRYTHWNENGDWYLESPCTLYQIKKIDKPIDQFCEEYVDGLLEEDVDINKYIEEYVKPMIINGILYEIENFQCSPYLPEEVDDIKLISERECLEYMLSKCE